MYAVAKGPRSYPIGVHVTWSSANEGAKAKYRTTETFIPLKEYTATDALDLVNSRRNSGCAPDDDQRGKEE